MMIEALRLIESKLARLRDEHEHRVLFLSQGLLDMLNPNKKASLSQAFEAYVEAVSTELNHHVALMRRETLDLVSKLMPRMPEDVAAKVIALVEQQFRPDFYPMRFKLFKEALVRRGNSYGVRVLEWGTRSDITASLHKVGTHNLILRSLSELRDDLELLRLQAGSKKDQRGSTKSESKIAQVDLPKFPDIIPSSVRETRLWIHENGDFKTKEDLSPLLENMYDSPEDQFFLFTPKAEGINPVVDGALADSTIVIVESQGHYYPHPKFKRDYVQIHEATVHWDWEREVLAQGKMYFRHELELSERARRKFEMQQLIEMQKAANSNPIKLEPNFMGIGLDLKKAFPWLKKQFKK